MTDIYNLIFYRLSQLEKREMLTYLIQDRIFISTLLDDDIDYCYTCFKFYRKNRVKKKIINFFKFRS